MLPTAGPDPFHDGCTRGQKRRPPRTGARARVLFSPPAHAPPALTLPARFCRRMNRIMVCVCVRGWEARAVRGRRAHSVALSPPRPLSAREEKNLHCCGARSLPPLHKRVGPESHNPLRATHHHPTNPPFSFLPESPASTPINSRPWLRFVCGVGNACAGRRRGRRSCALGAPIGLGGCPPPRPAAARATHRLPAPYTPPRR
jgi:hypothetical protein